MNALIIICLLITICSMAFALKKYVDMLIVIHIMQSKGIDISDNEIRSTSTYVIKKLLKL